MNSGSCSQRTTSWKCAIDWALQGDLKKIEKSGLV